ncbi:nicotinate-nucleotide--dimethylbenzimidazole phosphoribosyltransferase [Oceanispirochaeta crateris]|uniref:Nicotinate-nucleotide--dimethylbenzimidazole phosphoribosyltransferase n=1 Tax=Oceanispirochaeta crateris TaxID=2518645 RepID=A0A5C1QLU4_9SPIO|nr:nicotinate-nucleotide--dimethylbenzimidazole phosphoribosyltransferase [Oceanispirochaeta crateris]QEN07516.1 nicotinate-nucleotide--dimethylbenzimidazole phosphoribosyltransferase [Oceanispirochaeta crateris]
MNREVIQTLLEKIQTLDLDSMNSISARWDSLTKPPESLGTLERLVSQLGGIQRTSHPQIGKRTVLCFAADHGVVAEGVSPSKQIVTAEMVRNFLNGGAAISVLASCTNTALKVIDAGMVHHIEHPLIIQRSIACGTANMRVERAMTEEQVYQAIELGYLTAVEEIDNSCELLITGEMGVGNTTSASAIYAALTGMNAESVTGNGAGLPEHLVKHKARVIQDALFLHKPNSDDPIDVLSAVGGFELAAMCGVMLAGAVYGCPVLVDGFISGASAVLAMKLNPLIKEYLIFSHHSGESGFAEIRQQFGFVPLVDLNMRLGEGTGAVMILPLIDNALSCYYKMATFEEAGVTEVEL